MCGRANRGHVQGAKCTQMKLVVYRMCEDERGLHLTLTNRTVY